MNRYTIYCTEEQTKKALELGAPILVTPEEFYETLPHFNMNICGENASVVLPTAEEMINWLEVQGVLVDVEMRTGIAYVYDRKNKVYVKTINIHSRNEGTFVAIDVALDYLIEKKGE